MNIYQRINAVMKEVTYVQKDAQVQTYKAVTHDNVTAVLRPHLVEQGIVVHVTQTKGKVISEWESRSGAKFHRYAGRYDVSFINIEDAADRLTVTVHAHADDNADKAPGKCCSYATKYAMLKTFSLETGENEEGRYSDAPLFTDVTKDKFYTLLEGERALEFAAFSQEVGEEVMKALQGTFEKGKVSSGKAKVKALEQAGWDAVDKYALEISERIQADDPSVIELTEELSPTEKRMIASKLTATELAHLKKLSQLGG